MNSSLPATGLYDVTKRGAVAPDYSDAEARYRAMLLNELQLAYNTREQTHMELNDKSYSEYYLINRQQDMAYNPPKKNASDSRIVTGIIHEKDNTIESLIRDMNLQPKVEVFNHDDTALEDFATFATARLKKSLEKENFSDKIGDFARINVSQGNVFISEEKKCEYNVKKVPVANPDDPTKLKWTTVVEKGDEYCEAIAIPNTAVFATNLLENDQHKQGRIFVVLHLPKASVEHQYSKFPRWQSVPTYPTTTIVPNVTGNFGDFYLQQPAAGYVEYILMQSEVLNEWQVFINGVMMYPVQEENGKIVGFPLTYFSPSGSYTIVKGDNEKIPFFYYSKSVPTKNEVKEEVANEFLRIAVHKFRYSAFPSIGNNSDKVLPANIWDPSVVVPDIESKDISVLNPNGRLDQADFSFYEMIMNSIDETSVSKSVEGTNNADITATQYVDQKKENLKKLGITIDATMKFLQEIYWLRLWNEIEYLDKKSEKWSVEDQQFYEAYDSFMSEEVMDGQKGQVQFNLVDDVSGYDPYEMFKEEQLSANPVRKMYINAKDAKETLKRLKDKIKIRVVAEPDGQNQSLIGILFNLLTGYANLHGGVIPNLNYEYLDKIIGQNSGFEGNKLFTKVPLQSIMGAPGMMPENGTSATPGLPAKPKPPQNSILAGAN